MVIALCLIVGLSLSVDGASSASAKIAASKVASKDSSSSSSSSSNGADAADDCAEAAPSLLPPMPEVRLHGEKLTDDERPISNTLSVDGRTMHLRPLHDELQLTYVHGLIAEEEIDELVRLATLRSGWARSPLKSQQSGEALSKDDRRNSSSCPMLWPLVYASRLDEIAKAPGAEALLAELGLVSNLSSRVAELFGATGMELSAQFIEPLQVVKYAPTETFAPHRDYHEPDAAGNLGSSVQGEQRAFTVLLLGSTLEPEHGGETSFPLLGLAVSPRKGDAIIWANVDADGAPNPRSLHEGRPPSEGHEKVAVNVWVADRPFDLEGGMERAVRTGRGSRSGGVEEPS
jgi:hypothetical protein